MSVDTATASGRERLDRPPIFTRRPYPSPPTGASASDFFGEIAWAGSHGVGFAVAGAVLAAVLVGVGSAVTRRGHAQD